MKAALDYNRVPNFVKCETAPDLVCHLQRVTIRVRGASIEAGDTLNRLRGPLVDDAPS